VDPGLELRELDEELDDRDPEDHELELRELDEELDDREPLELLEPL
jgi:hypothetical protein